MNLWMKSFFVRFVKRWCLSPWSANHATKPFANLVWTDGWRKTTRVPTAEKKQMLGSLIESSKINLTNKKSFAKMKTVRFKARQFRTSNFWTMLKFVAQAKSLNAHLGASLFLHMKILKFRVFSILTSAQTFQLTALNASNSKNEKIWINTWKKLVKMQKFNAIFAKQILSKKKCKNTWARNVQKLRLIVSFAMKRFWGKNMKNIWKTVMNKKFSVRSATILTREKTKTNTIVCFWSKTKCLKNLKPKTEKLKG